MDKDKDKDKDKVKVKEKDKDKDKDKYKDNNKELFKELLKDLLNKYNTNIKEVITASNSFASNVKIITLDNDEKIVCKKSDINRTENEKKYLKYLRSLNEDKKIFVPEIIDVSNNDNLDNNNLNNDVVITKYVCGMNLIDEEVDKIDIKYLKLMGENLARLHMIDILSYDDNDGDIKRNIKWKTYIKDAIENCYDYFISNKTIIDNEIINKAYKYLIEGINVIDNAQFANIHRDYRPGNVIIVSNDKDNNACDIIYTIDFESMMTGDRAFDLVKTRNLLKDISMLDAFTNSYNNTLINSNYNYQNYNLEERISYYKIYEAFLAVKWCILKDRTSSEFYKDSFNTLVKL